MKDFKFLQEEFDFEGIAIPVYDIERPSPDSPAYYDTEDFTFIGLSPIQNTISRTMMFRENSSGIIIPGNRIERDHPMWNCTHREQTI